MKFKDSVYSKLNTPGPGAYQTFSEFGIYKSKNADKIDSKELYNAKNKIFSKTFSKGFNKNKSTGNLLK